MAIPAKRNLPTRRYEFISRSRSAEAEWLAIEGPRLEWRQPTRSYRLQSSIPVLTAHRPLAYSRRKLNGVEDLVDRAVRIFALARKRLSRFHRFQGSGLSRDDGSEEGIERQTTSLCLGGNVRLNLAEAVLL